MTMKKQHEYKISFSLLIVRLVFVINSFVFLVDEDRKWKLCLNEIIKFYGSIHVPFYINC